MIGGLVYLATILIIARAVSVTEFGKYSFVLAFAMFVNNVADSGLPRMLIREIAKDREGLVPLAGATLSLIWLISGVMCLLVAWSCRFCTSGADVKMIRSWHEFRHHGNVPCSRIQRCATRL